MNTIGQMIRAGSGDAAALRAPDVGPATYTDLIEFIEATGGALRAAGVSRGDRVGIVMPNGPAMASTFLSVVNAATAAPLNPSYQKSEFAFYLGDLKAKILIATEADRAAIAAAKDLGIPIALVQTSGASKAGICRPSLPAAGKLKLEDAKGSDEALILHTSGTTSRPKIVPLTHTNLSTSAANIAASLKLTESDSTLNIMPLFHIHGLVAAVLASLTAGASIYCTPGFNALKFFSWLSDAQPTWYTAVPSMHQAILTRAERNNGIVDASRLRLIRSSSSSLPSAVMANLQATFRCPVVEAYGMTEAAHQMTCNPIMQGRPNSVGIAAGPEVRLWTGTTLTTAAGVLGEVVIRGKNVTAGYEANDEANISSFIQDVDGDWFRTGDQGRLDSEGYLYLTGRLKEIINRGGEKISPLEIDSVLLDHPEVAEAVAFSIPHKQLGEEVGAAIVLKEGARTRAEDIRAFVAARIAAFKVPHQIIILDEIPKGATGKLQRTGLWEKLGVGKSA